ncbi:MAG: sugar phosphate isomerase/epimerase, partial [Planctomycetes bacterium]|nr:sugar phosphate isomerase/epimerase [Planctomycetota bacterium]
MRFGINMLLWTTRVTDEHAPQLEFVRACGFDGVELPIFHGEPRDYAALGRRLDAIGLQRTCSSGLAPEHDPIHEDSAVRRAAVDRLRWAIDCAHAAGSQVLCGPLHSAFKVFRGRGPDDD